MNITNDIKSISYLKSRTADVLKQVNELEKKGTDLFLFRTPRK